MASRDLGSGAGRDAQFLLRWRNLKVGTELFIFQRIIDAID